MCVHGETVCGVAAALGVADAGSTVIAVEPSPWLGGVSGGGLNAIDWGVKRTVGRMAKMLLLEKADVGMRAIDFTPANLYPAHAHNGGAEYKLRPQSRARPVRCPRAFWSGSRARPLARAPRQASRLWTNSLLDRRDAIADA